MSTAGLKFTESNEWVRMEGDVAIVGITDFAQSELGDVVYVGFPDLEEDVEQGEEFGEIESNKAVSDLKSPVTGTVLEVNEELVDFAGDEHPVNVDPYNSGWLIKIQVSNASDLDNLMDEAEYKAFLGCEITEEQ
jgi:glycine cleavage system H protein